MQDTGSGFIVFLALCLIRIQWNLNLDFTDIWIAVKKKTLRLKTSIEFYLKNIKKHCVNIYDLKMIKLLSFSVSHKFSQKAIKEVREMFCMMYAESNKTISFIKEPSL